MAELLAVLLSFWIFFPGVVAIILMFVWVAYEIPAGATVTMIVALLVFQFLGKVPIFGSVVAHPFWTILYIAVYFVAGIVWSVAKWTLWCHEIRDAYEEAKQDFFRLRWEPDPNARGNRTPQTQNEEWLRRCDHQFPQFSNGEFSARFYKGKILSWMTYWPWSFVWTMLNDVIRRVWNAIYLRIQRIYQAIADNTFKGILNDLDNDSQSQ